jgi:hypothetical protein
MMNDEKNTTHLKKAIKSFSIPSTFGVRYSIFFIHLFSQFFILFGKNKFSARKWQNFTEKQLLPTAYLS